MSATGPSNLSLRWGQAEFSRLAWALALSVACHLAIWGGYQAGRRFHVWENWRWPAWMVAPRMLTELFQKKLTPQELDRLRQQDKLREEQDQMRLKFVEVNPAKATLEPPKKAQYYSDKNSLASNPAPARNATVPKIDGKQDLVPSADDVPYRKNIPLQPTPQQPKPTPTPPPPPPTQAAPAKLPPVEPARVAQRADQPSPEAKPKPAASIGDLALAKVTEPSRTQPPQTQPGTADHPKPARSPHEWALTDFSEQARPDPGPAEQDRPRTLAAARAAQPSLFFSPYSEKMKQDGGVARLDLQPSLDAIATPFGDYDAAMVMAVKMHWYDLLEQRRWAWERTGKVVVRFDLNYDGSISHLKLMDRTVDLALALLCESAIREPAPYGRWPAELRHLVGGDHREITFTFYYR